MYSATGIESALYSSFVDRGSIKFKRVDSEENTHASQSSIERENLRAFKSPCEAQRKFVRSILPKSSAPLRSSASDSGLTTRNHFEVLRALVSVKITSRNFSFSCWGVLRLREDFQGDIPRGLKLSTRDL
jgi:hypothetical protein